MSIHGTRPIAIASGAPPAAGILQSLPPPLTTTVFPSGDHSGAARRWGESSTTFLAEPSTPTTVNRVLVASLPTHGGSPARDVDATRAIPATSQARRPDGMADGAG